MQRRHHYEQALEEYLRLHRIPYVAVDEARKALVPDRPPAPAPPPHAPTHDRGGQGAAHPAALKSFDLVVYGEGLNLLVEVKGRRAGPRLECWATEDDVDSLGRWEALFGEGFRSAFLFVYWCEQQPPAPLFEEIFEFRARWYAVRAVLLSDYRGAMRSRSPRWRTVDLPRPAFDRLAWPFTPAALAGPHRHDPRNPHAAPALHSSARHLASAP